ncbi:MAG TPA: NAD(P)/FAD-dependent oxidoreductase [Candidatus Thalassarchaeaceae archaeon]|jgi:phytoene dehydrogenase-like protein|nr:NAD(P)/FAD-dependent oxidoreductase [Candidatus Thalassarchaeaceae archaeon]
MPDWDVIIIGSGAGGLGAAVALSNIGKRVLVLEQHYLPGGWTHTFSLEGHKFSPGVHYMGGLGEGGDARELFEGLGVGGDLEFCELNPDGYDHIVFQDEVFDIPRGRDKFIQRLIDRFPEEKRGIERYFDLMVKVDRGIAKASSLRGPLDVVKLLLGDPAVVFKGMKPTSKMIDRYVKDVKLKAIFEARAGDHGLSPERAPFAQHVAIEGHYWEGAWYPKGGGGAIPKALISRLKKNGGEIRVKARVEKILIEGTGKQRRAVGVRMVDGEEIKGKNVLSNADAWITYSDLVGNNHLSKKMAKRVEKLEPSISALSLFVATDLDVDALGLDSGNYWILNNPSVDATYCLDDDDVLNGEGAFPGGFLTVTTKKDPSKMKDGIHTMEAFTFVPYSPFERWKNSECENRPEDYEELKQHLIERMLDTVEGVAPGLRDHLILCELGSPLTNVHYVNSYRGNLYATAKSKQQIGLGALPIETEINGLYHCGQSTAAHGVLGALLTGVIAAGKISGKKVNDILKFSDAGKIKLHPTSIDNP